MSILSELAVFFRSDGGLLTNEPSGRWIPLLLRWYGLPKEDPLAGGDGTCLMTCWVTWPPTLMGGSWVVSVLILNTYQDFVSSVNWKINKTTCYFEKAYHTCMFPRHEWLSHYIHMYSLDWHVCQLLLSWHSTDIPLILDQTETNIMINTLSL